MLQSLQLIALALMRQAVDLDFCAAGRQPTFPRTLIRINHSIECFPRHFTFAI